MRYYNMLTCLCSLLLLLFASSGFSANLHGDTQSLPYDVFTKAGADLSAVESLMKNVCNIEELKPKYDAQHKLVSWTVEVDTLGVTQLCINENIERVAHAPNDSINPAGSTQRTPSDEIVMQWVVGAVDEVTDAQIAEVEQFIDSLPGTHRITIRGVHNDFYHWIVDMTDSQHDQVVAHPYIYGADINSAGEELGVARENPSTTTGVQTRPGSLKDGLQIRRSAQNLRPTYTTQQVTVDELVFVSQPSDVANISLFKNYVYEENAGKGSFVYHLEQGVATLEFPEEFVNVGDYLLTPMAGLLGYTGDTDPRANGHSTCTADKAVGKQYGVAKGATLIPVVVTSLYEEPMIEGFLAIARDL